MKSSNLLKALLQRSEFESETTLSKATGVSQSTINRMMKGEGSFERLDKVFDALSPDLSVEKFMILLDLYEEIKKSIIEEEQFL